jgi:CRP/FNR family transcriptional regulator, cyclic AMP receptor protein
LAIGYDPHKRRSRLAAMVQPEIRQAEYSLSEAPLLRRLSPASLQRVQGSVNWRRYEPGEPIIEYLDRSDDVFFMASGEARVVIYSLAGKAVSFHDLKPGDMFGEYPAIDGRQRSASVEARTSCLVASMTAAFFPRAAARGACGA